ncbi:MAG TPA: hypothetical protein VFY92_04085 [Hyphomicrobiaceae bacterium]|nr:hypothetical protein [Hyphomicrobiaceae bacterium]
MLRIASGLVLIASTAAIGAAGAAALRADLIVGYGVSKALETRQAPAQFELATAKPASRPDRDRTAEVGDEGYWLTRGGAATPVMLGQRLAVGDRISITGQDGRVRHLRVIDLSLVDTPILNVADSTASLWLVRVTCRAVGRTADKSEPVRFFVEAEGPKPAHLAPAARGGALGPT